MVITNNIITITMWCKDGCFNKLLLLYNNNDNNNKQSFLIQKIKIYILSYTEYINI